MKAAPEDQVILLDVQRLDNDVTRIAHRITSLQKGDQLTELSKQAAALRSELVAATGEVEDAERDLARLESDTAVAQARVERDTTMLQNVANAKDAAGLQSELDSLQRRIGGLETAELEIMENLDGLRARVGDIEANLADVEAARGGLVAERDAEIARLTADRESAEQARADVAAKVPAELLALYDRQRARYGFGASLLQGGVSTASGVALNNSDLQTIRRAAPDDVVLCPDSDAILVRTAESGL
ncbi:zinc ribbon domain-containing protein [Curtobacterium flaccumfaciens pv. flaccumfaciens]|uniref:zinc ribbon domain-containing protein n=1 Tax=Curtobacterium flaccumfaciens TaxID=2035 RepID=UPI003AB20ACB